MALRALIWLNVIDTLLTISVVSLKWATEANPIMEYALQQGPMIFGATKLAMTVAGTLILWKARKSKWSMRAAYGLTICYAVLITYEAAMILVMAVTGAS